MAHSTEEAMEMLGTRIVVAVILATSSMAIVPGGASANGGSFFDFDDAYFVPGDYATGETTFSSRVKRSGRIEDGPYFAYLLPSDRWINPPRIPETAVPLGSITVTRWNRSLSTARVSFTIPNVQPGLYTVALCNTPCRHASIGDLAGGSIAIVPTKEEALRREIIDQVDTRLTRVRQRLAARITGAEKAQQRFAPRSEVQELTERVTALQKRIAGMQRAQRRESPTAAATAWIVAALVLLIAGLLSLRSRLRRERPTARRRRSDRRDEAIPMVPADEEDLSEVRERSARDLETADL